MRLDGVSMRYGWRGPWVLRGVDLELPAGRVVRAEGANGCGKSTLLRVVAGAVLPSRGTVRERPGRAAYVPERFPSALPFTPREYLRLTGRVHGLSGAVAARRTAELLERFAAAGFADTPLAGLSKGTCQKVAVVQALIAEPGLLVLDEAWTGLDEAARAVLDQAVAERAAAGGRVVFVDHDPSRLADRTDVRWSVGGGTVVAATAAPAARSVRIECTGSAASAPALGALPGVRGVQALPDGVRLETDEAHSDGVLRALLADESTHIRNVAVTGGRR